MILLYSEEGVLWVPRYVCGFYRVRLNNRFYVACSHEFSTLSMYSFTSQPFLYLPGGLSFISIPSHMTVPSWLCSSLAWNARRRVHRARNSVFPCLALFVFSVGLTEMQNIVQQVLMGMSSFYPLLRAPSLLDLKLDFAAVRNLWGEYAGLNDWSSGPNVCLPYLHHFPVNSFVLICYQSRLWYPSFRSNPVMQLLSPTFSFQPSCFIYYRTLYYSPWTVNVFTTSKVDNDENRTDLKHGESPMHPNWNKELKKWQWTETGRWGDKNGRPANAEPRIWFNMDDGQVMATPKNS